MLNSLIGYKIQISKRAQKSLEDLHSKIQNKLIEKLKILVSTNPHGLDIKKLESFDNLYRIRYGNYRIVYEPIHNKIIVYVIFIGHRKNIYSELKKLY